LDEEPLPVDRADEVFARVPAQKYLAPAQGHNPPAMAGNVTKRLWEMFDIVGVL